ncbi:hypothetical protein BKA83DRAFT_4122569 [Pisolithus microcarpus]|nr:hypothetical protein BKA83DRAFT_4122569 [Pisolithus microcarpus]
MVLLSWMREWEQGGDLNADLLLTKGGRGDGGGTKCGSANTQLHTGSPLQTVDARSKEAHTGVGAFVNVGRWWKLVQWRVESRGGGGGSLNADLSIPNGSGVTQETGAVCLLYVADRRRTVT